MAAAKKEALEDWH